MKDLIYLTILMGYLFALSGCSFVSEFKEKTTSLVVSPVDTTPALDVCSNAIVNEFGGGNGTMAYPFLICNLQQWNYFATTTTTWDKYIMLKADLDFSGIVYADLKILNDATATFTGVFDGGNKKIMNINVNTGADAFALFGNTSGAPTFKNLTVENITILSGNAVSTFVKQHAAGGVLTFDHVNLKTAQYSNPASGFVMTSLGSLNVQDATVQGFTISALNSFAAGIVATLRADGTFNNVLIDGFTMNYTCCNFPDYSAGLVGYAFGSPTPSMITITNSIVKNATIGGSTVFRYAGGLIGRALDMSVAISNSSFAGTIYAKDSGGLVGYVEPLFSTDRTLAITNSSVNATFSNCGNGICGGLVGWIIANGTISNSFYKGALTNNTGLSGGLVGQIDGNVSINDSYSAANLTKTGGSGTLGGIVGGISAGVVNINRSYYAGIMVAGVPPIKSGCLVAANFATLNVADAYYDDSLCTKNSVDSGGYAGANNVATGALQTAAPFVNWLPANWVFTAAQNPKLLWEP